MFSTLNANVLFKVKNVTPERLKSFQAITLVNKCVWILDNFKISSYKINNNSEKDKGPLYFIYGLTAENKALSKSVRLFMITKSRNYFFSFALRLPLQTNSTKAAGIM